MLDQADRPKAVDFVQAHEDGLAAITSFADAEYIVEALRKRGMSGRDLFERMCHSKYLNTLMDNLISVLDATRRVELGMQVWKFRRDETFLSRTTSSSIQNVLTVDEIYEHLLENVPIEELRMYVSRAPDDYWRRQIQGLISKGSLDHAWDEILDANDPKCRYAASPVCLAALIGVLAKAVGEEKTSNASPRHIQLRSRAGALLLTMEAAFSGGLNHEFSKRIAESIHLLHNYFGGRRSKRCRVKR